MARRSHSAEMNEARRTALRNLLVEEERFSPDVAEAWVRAWEAEAARLGIAPGSESWTIGSVWIREQRQLGRSP